MGGGIVVGKNKMVMMKKKERVGRKKGKQEKRKERKKEKEQRSQQQKEKQHQKEMQEQNEKSEQKHQKETKKAIVYEEKKGHPQEPSAPSSSSQYPPSHLPFSRRAASPLLSVLSKKTNHPSR